MSKKRRVKIWNPVPGGAPFIGQVRAEHYVRTGRAAWISPDAIRFDEYDHRYQSALASAMQTRFGYDQRGGMTLNEIKNIPVLNPQKLRR